MRPCAQQPNAGSCRTRTVPLMRFFLDTEFIDDAAGTDLISIGLVAANGAEFYAVSSEYDRAAAEARPWLAEHVLPLLDRPGEPDPLPRAVIAADLEKFCLTHDDGRKPEVWACHGSYDFYLLAKLYGRQLDVPAAVPTSFFDLKQWARSLGNVTVPAQESDHHPALADARHDRDVWRWLADYENRRQVKRDERVRARLITAATDALRSATLH